LRKISRTLSDKKQEFPIEKLLLGQPLEKVITKDAMANPECPDCYLAFAKNLTEKNLTNRNFANRNFAEQR
jgi:acetoacetyl-CoA synthetase